MGWMRYKPYVPVSIRREQADKKIASLKRQGAELFPIEIEGRKITNTLWGNAWCEHIILYADSSYNRLPRGRTYVRTGAVCHLVISECKVEAIVAVSYTHLTLPTTPYV